MADAVSSSSAEPSKANPIVGLSALMGSLKKRKNEEMAASSKSEADGGVKIVETGIHASHPFFSYYGLLVHQQNMLQDLVRTGCYRDAIVSNPADFAGKTVMDVGTGSGILAWFAVQAGAQHVYAIDASAAADRAKQLLEANGVADRVTVVKAKVEEVELPSGPNSVDTLVSEPMGFMLIHEQMLKSYIAARKLFLKPGGKMFPNNGIIYAAPFTDHALWSEQAAKVTFWQSTDFYGLNLTSLADAASQDHFAQAIVGYVNPSSLLTPATVQHVIDFEKDEPESLDEISMPLEFVISRPALCHGLACWFTVDFNGSNVKVVLDTGPHSAGTHWYQCRLLLREPMAVNAGQRITGSLLMNANDRYSYNLVLTMAIAGSEASTADGQPVKSTVAVNLADQQYNFNTNMV